MTDKKLPHWKQKVLFTPGPLTTSASVKQAMLRDVGSRDSEFIEIIAWVRQRLLQLANVADRGYETVLLQGSGTFAVEAVLTTATPAKGKWLVIENGAYGKRIALILDRLGIARTVLSYAENQYPDLAEIEATLVGDESITHIAIIHNETTTGLVNPIDRVGALAKRYGKSYFVDAMSSFGAFEMDLEALNIDWLACTANKNLEGVPGIAFVLARRSALLAAEGNSRSLVLDLADQLRGFERNGQFRFTPPTHAILALKTALEELELEGGVRAREARYRLNHETLVRGMRELGFKEYLPPEKQGHIIVSFFYPEHPNFEFDIFYNKLNKRGYVIYPGKVSDAECFRIGVCGRIFKSDILDLLNAIRDILDEMDVNL